MDASPVTNTSLLADNGTDKDKEYSSCNNLTRSQNMAAPKIYERKCPFHQPSENVKFNNKPGAFEQVFIRTFHWFQRHVVQGGGLQSCNPITRIFAFFCFAIDLVWAGVDKQYYVKRQAMYGPNFISTLSLVVSKFDGNRGDKDSIDARLVTIPQRRGFYLGSTIMNPKSLYYYGKNKKKMLTPLFVSDPGTTMDSKLPADQPDHNVLQDYLLQHFLGDKQVDAVLMRQNDETAGKLLKAFGQTAKGKTGEELGNAIADFLPAFLIYTLFDTPVDNIPLEEINESYTSLKFVLAHYGGKPCAGELPGKMRSALDTVADYLSENSKVLKSVPDGPAELTKADLIEMIHLIFGIAAFQGTRALATTSMTQMPKGYAETVVNDEDPNKLRNAILECARLDTPVTGAHCLVDDDEGLTTTIGGKTLKFPNGTIIFNAMTLANVDESRYANPFVFDPENRDFTKLTSFHSVGESTGPGNRICPGRRAAISAVELMIKAKVAADTSGIVA